MTDNNEKDPFGSISISSDRPAAKRPEKKKPEKLPGKSRVPSITEKIAPSETKMKEEDERPGPERRKIPQKSSPLLLWAAVCLIAGVTGYILGGFFAVPYFLRTSFPAALSKKMDRPVTVGNAGFNPFTFRCTLTNTIIGPVLSDPEDKIDPLFSIDSLAFTISPASFFRRKLIADNVNIDHLFLHLARTGEKSYNLSNLFKQTSPQSEAEQKNEAGWPYPFLVTNISAASSRIIFEDLPVGKTHTVENINLDFPAFFYDTSGKTASQRSLLGAGTLIRPKFSAVINGSPVELSGDTSVTEKGIEAQLRLQLDHIDLPYYLGYLPYQPGFNIEKGTAAGQVELVFLSPADSKARLEIKAKATLDNVLMTDTNGNKSKLPETSIQGSFMPLEGRYAFSEVKATKPEFQITREKDGSWDFPDILLYSFGKTKKADPPLVSIDILQINAGKISFIDNHIPGGFSETLADLNMTVKNLSPQSGKFSSYVLSGTTVKSKIACQGELSLAPVHMTGLLVANQLRLSQFFPYLTLSEGLEVKEGEVPRIETRFDLILPAAEKDAPRVSFTELSAELTGLKLTQKNKEWLSFSKAHLTADTINAADKILHLKELTIENPFFFSSWNRKNLSNRKDFLAPTPAEKRAPWNFKLSEAEIKNGTVRIEDHSWDKPFLQTLAEISGKITGLSNQKNSAAKMALSASGANGGTLELDGTVSLSPFKTVAKCGVREFPVAGTAAFFGNWLTPAVTAGVLQADGQVAFPQFSFKGSLQIADFQATAADKKKILSWKKGSAEKVSFSNAPREIFAGAIVLEQPYLNWTITSNDTVFNGGIFRRPAFLEKAGNEPKDRVRIDSLQFNPGTVDIADTRVSPPFTSSVRFSGSISDIADSDDTLAAINLKGSASGNSSVTVSGNLGLLHEKFSCDVTTRIAGQDIKSVGPQLESILVYEIKNGTFDFLAGYRQKSKQVTGSHSIVLTDFSIGSPKDKKGQLPLTIALLTDRNGIMKLDLPISGSVSEKSYSYPKALQRAIQNVVLKSTVSPFALMLASFPGIKEIPDHVLFTAGDSSLTPQNIETLNNLHAIVHDRPGLTLHIKGYADAQEDRDALLEMKKKAMDKKQLALEQIRSAILSESYGKELIQPAPIPGQPAESVPDRVILSVKEKELENLAKDREESIRDYLIDTMHISGDRITLDGTGTIIPANAMGHKGSRADFSLGTKNN